MADLGIVLRGPAPKPQLVQELAQARACLYRGDIGETFCSAVAEAQAMGVPVVLEDVACMRERLVDGITGSLVRGEDAFAEAAIAILSDDELWSRRHAACLERQRSFGWDDAAAMFERLMD